MKELLKDIVSWIMAQGYATYLLLVIGVLMTFILLVLNLLKKPIKKLTSRIEDEKLRKLANKSIILLSFGISALVWFLLAKFAPNYFTFNFPDFIMTGALPVVVYALGDGVIGKAKAQSIVETLKEVVEEQDPETGKAVIKTMLTEIPFSSEEQVPAETTVKEEAVTLSSQSEEEIQLNELLK